MEYRYLHNYILYVTIINALYLKNTLSTIKYILFHPISVIKIKLANLNKLTRKIINETLH